MTTKCPIHLFVPQAVIHPWTANYLGWTGDVNIPLVVMYCDLASDLSTKQYSASIWREWTFEDHAMFREFFRRWNMRNQTLRAYPEENRITWKGDLDL